VSPARSDGSERSPIGHDRAKRSKAVFTSVTPGRYAVTLGAMRQGLVNPAENPNDPSAAHHDCCCERQGFHRDRGRAARFFPSELIMDRAASREEPS
jgi:hypothetical protein